jgi:LPXTG-motif cell wall-anchored protein
MKRKLLALIITAALVVAVFPCTAFALDTWDGTADTTWYAGYGDYTISTAEQLAGLAVLVNTGAAESGGAPADFSGMTITLGDDIDLAGYDWTPIGTFVWASLVDLHPFSGTFDGNGHTISNMTVSDITKIGAGLFGYTTSALIEDLGVVNCTVAGQGVAGGLAGLADENTSIHDCYTTGTVMVVYTEGADGYNGEMAGGLVGNYGQSLSTIDGCHSSANVGGDSLIGGLVGYSSAAHIMNSYATGDVMGDCEAFDLGGFIGGCDQSVIEHCYATGSVTAGGDVGGFVGLAYSNGDNNQIINCYATGGVTSTYTDLDTGDEYGWCAGGFIGYIESTDIYNCYSAGHVGYTAADEAYYIGGFVGDFEGYSSFTDCFVDTQAAGREAEGNGGDGTSVPNEDITGLTTANMQGCDALINTAKADSLDSGAGAPVAGVPVWYAHAGAFYPDFNPEGCDIAFDSQGATTPAVPAALSAVVGLPVDAMPSDPSRTGFDFGGWWTSPLGMGTEFTGTTPAPGDMAVYALWINESSASVFVGGRVTLSHIGPAGGNWGYDDHYVTLEDLGDGTVRITGVAAGTTQVIYLTPETVEIFDITIAASGLPNTGQDATIIYLLCGLALLLLGAGAAAIAIRRKAAASK